MPMLYRCYMFVQFLCVLRRLVLGGLVLNSQSHGDGLELSLSWNCGTGANVDYTLLGGLYPFSDLSVG